MTKYKLSDVLGAINLLPLTANKTCAINKGFYSLPFAAVERVRYVADVYCNVVLVGPMANIMRSY